METEDEAGESGGKSPLLRRTRAEAAGKVPDAEAAAAEAAAEPGRLFKEPATSPPSAPTSEALAGFPAPGTLRVEAAVAESGDERSRESRGASSSRPAPMAPLSRRMAAAATAAAASAGPDPGPSQLFTRACAGHSLPPGRCDGPDTPAPASPPRGPATAAAVFAPGNAAFPAGGAAAEGLDSECQELAIPRGCETDLMSRWTLLACLCMRECLRVH